MESKEIWKYIKGFEGKYKISNHGNAKSVDRVVNGHPRKGVYLKLQKDSDGYKMINITSSKRKNHSKKIHRLVYCAFGEFKLNKNDIVCHIDGNKENNNYKNLYKGDVISNTIDRYNHGTTKLNINQVKEIKSLIGTMKQSEIAEKFNIKPSYVSRD